MFMKFLIPLFFLFYLYFVDECATASEEQVVENNCCHKTDKRNHWYVLGLIGKGRATDGVPIHAIIDRLSTRQTVEVIVFFIIITYTQVWSPFQNLKGNVMIYISEYCTVYVYIITYNLYGGEDNIR